MFLRLGRASSIVEEVDIPVVVFEVSSLHGGIFEVEKIHQNCLVRLSIRVCFWYAPSIQTYRMDGVV